MITKNFAAFLVKNRFQYKEIADYNDDVGLIVSLSEFFSPFQTIGWDNYRKEIRKITIAMFLGYHMADSCIERREDFARLLSELGDDEWLYSLKYCPYYEVDLLFKNLELIKTGMEEVCIGLNTSLKIMELSISEGIISDEKYHQEKVKATLYLMNFSMLYSAYVDICRKIRKKNGMPPEKNSSDAIRRIIKKNQGPHVFAKELRNFFMHFRIISPSASVNIRFEDRYRKDSHLYIASHELLSSGYRWNLEARQFIQSSDDIDVIKTIFSVIKDVAVIIKFHQKLVSIYLKKEKSAFEYYSYERKRFKHLQNSIYDIGKALGRPQSLLVKLVGDEAIDQIFSSALSNEQVHLMLSNLANRHQNIPNRVKEKIEEEIKKSLINRNTRDNLTPYLEGRPVT